MSKKIETLADILEEKLPGYQRPLPSSAKKLHQEAQEILSQEQLQEVSSVLFFS